MKKIVVAMDSFKGSINSMEAGNAVKAGIQKVYDAQVIVKPLADGGEGTIGALIDGLGGHYIPVEVTGPLGDKILAKYGILKDGITVVIEMAEAAGLARVRKGEKNPLKATTYGVGEMILDAIRRGYRRFIIGIGGSATSEAGVGMLQALGYEITDEKGETIRPGIQDLDRITSINKKHVPEELEECQFSVACDVSNPLCGKSGAVYVYGSQKGVKDEEKELFDKKLLHFAEKTKEYTGQDYQRKAGAGAAGGLGFAFLSYLPNVELKPGIDIIIEETQLEKEIKDADIVITGEGRIDHQTAMGKAPAGIARIAKKYGAKVIAFAGGVTDQASLCNEAGIDAFFPVVRGITTKEEAMNPENAMKNIELTVAQVFRLIRTIEENDTINKIFCG